MTSKQIRPSRSRSIKSIISKQSSLRNMALMSQSSKNGSFRFSKIDNEDEPSSSADNTKSELSALNQLMNETIDDGQVTHRSNSSISSLNMINLKISKALNQGFRQRNSVLLPSSKSEISSIGLSQVVSRDGTTIESDDEGVSIDSSVQSFARVKNYQNFNNFSSLAQNMKTFPPDKRISSESSPSFASHLTFGPLRKQTPSTTTVLSEDEEGAERWLILVHQAGIPQMVSKILASLEKNLLRWKLSLESRIFDEVLLHRPTSYIQSRLNIVAIHFVAVVNSGFLLSKFIVAAVISVYHPALPEPEKVGPPDTPQEEPETGARSPGRDLLGKLKEGCVILQILLILILSGGILILNRKHQLKISTKESRKTVFARKLKAFIITYEFLLTLLATVLIIPCSSGFGVLGAQDSLQACLLSASLLIFFCNHLLDSFCLGVIAGFFGMFVTLLNAISAQHQAATAINWASLAFFLALASLLQGYSTLQIRAGRTNEKKLAVGIQSIKKDIDTIMHNLPQGILIYQLQQGFRSEGTPSEKNRQHPTLTEEGAKLVTKYVNNRLTKIFDSKPNQMKSLMLKKHFRQVMYKEDGSSAYWRKDYHSIRDIIMEFQGGDKTLFYQYQSQPPIGDKMNFPDVDEVSVGSVSQFGQSCSLFKNKKTDYEIMIKEIMYGLEPAYIMIFQDISNVIKSQSSKMQKQYQEAMTATISHEQMNPLNSIIYFAEYLQERFKDQLRTFGYKTSVTEFSEATHGGQKQDSPMVPQKTQSMQSEMSKGILEISKQDLSEQLRVVTIVHNSSMQMKLLNSAMLNSTLIKQNKFKPNLEVIKNPFITIRNFVRLFKEHIELKKIKVIIDKNLYGEKEMVDLVKTFGFNLDIQLYEQILYNIFFNACKFNTMNGQIKLSFQIKRPHYQQQPPNSARSGIKHVLIVTQIDDTGVGMNRQTKNNLFKIFESIKQRFSNDLGGIGFSTSSVKSFNSGHGPSNMASQGVGLGLHLSQLLAQYLHGDIEVESELEKGTEVKISLLVSINQQEGEDDVSRPRNRNQTEQLTMSTFGKKMDLKKKSPSIKFAINRHQTSSLAGTPFLPITPVKNEVEDDFSRIIAMSKPVVAVEEKKQQHISTQANEAALSKRKRKSLGLPQFSSFSDQNSPFSVNRAKQTQKLTFQDADSIGGKKSNFKSKFSEYVHELEDEENCSSSDEGPEPEVTPAHSQLRRFRRSTLDQTDSQTPQFLPYVNFNNAAKEAVQKLEGSDSSSQNDVDAIITSMPTDSIVNYEIISDYLQVQERESSKRLFLMSLKDKYESTKDVRPAGGSDLNLSAVKHSGHEQGSNQDPWLSMDPQSEEFVLVGLNKDRLDAENSQRSCSLSSFDSDEIFNTEDEASMQVSCNQGAGHKEEAKVPERNSESSSEPEQDLTDGDEEEKSADDEQQAMLLEELINKVKNKSKRKMDNNLHQIKEDIEEDLQSSTVKYRKSYNFDESSAVTFEQYKQEFQDKNESRRSQVFDQSEQIQIQGQDFDIDEHVIKRRRLSDNEIYEQRKINQERLGKRLSNILMEEQKGWCCNNSPILIVDDNIFNLETLKLMIKEKFGFEADCAKNGIEAVEMFKSRNIDEVTAVACKAAKECQRSTYSLIFMDLNMPIMDGFDATIQIQSLQAKLKKKCKIVALTAFFDRAKMDRCFEVGMCQVLNKPAKVDIISQVIITQCPHLEAMVKLMMKLKKPSKKKKAVLKKLPTQKILSNKTQWTAMQSQFCK